MPLPISKFIRSRLNKTRLHREWKEGRKSIETQRKGAPPPACISFDFAMPSIFIPVGEGRDRATIEHNVDGTREACRMAPFRLISIAAKRGKGKNYRVFQRLGDLSRGTWPTMFERKKRDRNGLARLAARFSRKIGTPVNTSPVAVGRGRELESPFAIIYFKTF